MKTIIAARAAKGRHNHENLRNGTCWCGGNGHGCGVPHPVERYLETGVWPVNIAATPERYVEGIRDAHRRAEIAEMIREVEAAREVCATKCDVGGNAHNSDWVVIREDDPMFDGLVAMDRYKNQVRDVRHPELYEDCTAYDFEGPC